MNHTWHPNTFGLLYGKTTKTACGKRVQTTKIVAHMETDCPGCQDVVIADMLLWQEMLLAAHDLQHPGTL